VCRWLAGPAGRRSGRGLVAMAPGCDAVGCGAPRQMTGASHIMSHMTFERGWTDEQLRTAVAKARSWRGVLRELGLKGTSTVRLRIAAERLGLDCEHFTSQRTWDDRQLREAITQSSTWAEVARRLNLADNGGSTKAVRAYAFRLGLDVTHLVRPAPKLDDILHGELVQPKQIRVAATAIAMAWFMLRGWACSIPAEPCAYDLIADVAGTLKRIQVKSMTRKDRYGNPTGAISHPGSRAGNPLVPYAADEVDLFFIVDGDLTLYVVPFEAVAGQVTITLSAYDAYRVGSADSLAGCSAAGQRASSGS
jgi:PD-(D/E)XK nuclease superfamily protein